VAITLCGPAFQQVHLASGLVTLLTRSCNPAVQARRFRLFRFRSPLLSESLLIYFPPGTEMVHFPGLARTRLYIQRAVYRFYRYGFPHSEIPGSKPACGSPRLIAASHVLHRLLAPRHPPYALSSLTIKLTRHVAAATCFFAEFRADNSPFFFPQFALSSRTCGLKTLRISSRPKSGPKCSAYLPASSVVKELRPWVPPRAFRARRNVRKLFEPKIKNPASSAGPIRLQTSTSGFARCSTRDYPVFVTDLT
jgi:hypothetical protein